MTSDQKTVAIGAVSGIVGMMASLWIFTRLLPDPGATDLASRLAYALKWDALAALPLFFMLAAVGNARFLSEAIDPTLGKENQKMIVDGKVADNTLQQFAIFVVGTTALAAGLEGNSVKVVGAAAITFVIMRIAFWIGYRIKPVYRAFGFSSTAYMNLGLLVAAIWFALR
jgi:uncharacterized MAPEG superfamily protein